MVDNTLDTRRLSREQEQTLAAASNVSLNMVKPWLQFNMAACRLYSDSWNAWMNNMEKATETAMYMIEQQQPTEANKAQRSA